MSGALVKRNLQGQTLARTLLLFRGLMQRETPQEAAPISAGAKVE